LKALRTVAPSGAMLADFTQRAAAELWRLNSQWNDQIPRPV
jgi:hypothetical protein